MYAQMKIIYFILILLFPFAFYAQNDDCARINSLFEYEEVDSLKIVANGGGGCHNDARIKLSLLLLSNDLDNSFEIIEMVDGEQKLWLKSLYYSRIKEWDSVFVYLEKYLQSDQKIQRKELLANHYLLSFWNTAEGRDLIRKDWYSKEDKDVAEMEYLLEYQKLVEAEELLAEFSGEQKMYYLLILNVKNGALKSAKRLLPKLKGYDELYYNATVSIAKNESSVGGFKDALLTLHNIRESLLIKDYPLYAFVYYQLEQYENALFFIDRYLTYYYKDIDVLLLKANVLIDSGRYLDALVLLNQLIENNDGCNECYIKRAQVYFKLKYYDKSFNDYSYSLDLSPLNPDVFVERARLRLSMGNRKGACFDFKQAKALGRNDIDELINTCCVER